MGLVAREIEAEGLTTVALSIIPELTVTTGTPRVAGVEHPFDMTMGAPDDVATQSGVLRSALEVMQSANGAGEITHLPFALQGDTPPIGPPTPAPIVKYLMLHPWAVPRFFNRNPPPVED